MHLVAGIDFLNDVLMPPQELLHGIADWFTIIY